MRGNEPSFPAMEKERRTAPPSVRPSVRPLITSSIVQRNDPNYARNRRVSIRDEWKFVNPRLYKMLKTQNI